MERFADWYTDTIFPLWTASLGRLTSLVPWSVGEWLLLAALCFVIVLLLIVLHHLITLVPPFKKRVKTSPRFVRFRKRFYKGSTILILFVTLIMVLNCFLCYRCAPINAAVRTHLPETDATLALSSSASSSSGDARLTLLRDYCVTYCNAVALTLPRDAEGNLLASNTPESAVPPDDVILQNAQRAVQSLSAAYPRLKGFQVRPKPLFFSVFVSQQNMQGYYFPFSMEANYNALVQRTNLPFAVAHELAHTHGYLREDECNFLAFLACLHAEDDFSRYSGWLSVLYYLDRDFKKSVSKEAYAAHPEISPYVRLDAQFLSKENREKVETQAVLDTALVQKATDTYVDTTLKANGVATGKESYAEVVQLLLRYFFD